jgi:hypothetical protein
VFSSSGATSARTAERMGPHSCYCSLPAVVWKTVGQLRYDEHFHFARRFTSLDYSVAILWSVWSWSR